MLVVEITLIECINRIIDTKTKWLNAMDLTVATFDYLGIHDWKKTNVQEVLREDGKIQSYPTANHGTIIDKLDPIIKKIEKKLSLQMSIFNNVLLRHCLFQSNF
jgi:hypothetical protein